MKKKVMQRAWQLAKQGVQQFGGKAREYFAVSLQMAWAEIKEESSMEIKFDELIKKYSIRIVGGNLGADKSIAKHPEDVKMLKENKQAIINHIKSKEEAKKQEYLAYKASVEAIEGLAEIETAMYSWAEWNKKFRKSFDGEYAVGGMGIESPVYTEDAINSLKAKYPRATAFLKAESWSNASHYYKSRLGEDAKHRIAAGEDYKKVISEIETKWEEYRAENID